MDAAQSTDLAATAAAAAAARSIQPTKLERHEWSGEEGERAEHLTNVTQRMELHARLFTLANIYIKGRMAQMGGDVLMKREREEEEVYG